MAGWHSSGFLEGQTKINYYYFKFIIWNKLNRNRSVIQNPTMCSRPVGATAAVQSLFTFSTTRKLRQTTSLHHVIKTHEDSLQKPAVQVILRKVTTVQWFYSWLFDSCKRFLLTSPTPKKKKRKKKKNKPGKQGLVLKFDSIEIKVLSLAGIQTDPNFAQCFFGNCSGIHWISVFVRIEKQTANLSHWYKQNKEGKRALIYLEGKVRAYTCVCVCIDICRHWGLTDRFWRPM